MKRNLLLSVLTAVMLAFALPPFRTGFIGWFALYPFFLLLEGKTAGEGMRWSYLTGLFICITTLYWIANVTQAGFIAAILIIPFALTLYGLLHILLLRRFGRKAWLLLPFLWLAIEYLQSLSETAFPWNYLGYTQSYYLPLIQFAEYTGIWGVSLWVFVLNVLIWLTAREFTSRPSRQRVLLALALLIVLPALHGLFVLRRPQDSGRPVTLALLQGNVDPFEKWEVGSTDRNVALYEAMSRDAAAGNPDLIVWPETAMPFFLGSEPRYLRRLHNFIDSLQIPLLTGGLDYQFTDDTSYSYYNAAFLIEPGSRFLTSYRKMRLVPGSERIPFRDYFPFNYLKDWLSDLELGVGDYTPGEEFTVFSVRPAQGGADAPPVLLSTPICFESVFPDLIRRFAGNGAGMLCIITNDAWFGRTSAPFQHTRFAVFRAIENRLPVARCANTGISCFIDPCGRVTQSTPLFKQAAITGWITLQSKRTLYTRYGDWLAHSCALIAAAGLIGAGILHLRSGKKHAQAR